MPAVPCLRRFRPLLSIAMLAVLAGCGGPQGEPVEVTAREYAFEGLPATLEAGPVEFSISNEGGEVHELHVFEMSDDVGTVAELLEMSQDESMDLLESVGMAMANPGDTESFDAELAAGRYAAVCLIPVGTLPAEGHAGHNQAEMEDMVFDPNANTHFRRGMYAEFEVS